MTMEATLFSKQEAFEFAPPDFDGKTYERERDHKRLNRQLESVKRLMSDGQWRTLEQIADAVGAPPASVSARLRDLRKPKFAGLQVERRYVKRGLFEYRVKIDG